MIEILASPGETIRIEISATTDQEPTVTQVERGAGGRWRVGRTLGRTIYLQTGEGASKGDTYMGVASTRGVAARFVDALNGARFLAAPNACSYGQLVFLTHPKNVCTDWVIATDTDSVAQLMVEAIKGERRE